MAQLDKLLQAIAPRGGKGLVLTYDKHPTLMMADNSMTPIREVPPLAPTMVSALTMDIIPLGQHRADWECGKDVHFRHRVGERAFAIRCRRESGAIFIHADLLAVPPREGSGEPPSAQVTGAPSVAPIPELAAPPASAACPPLVAVVPVVPPEVPSLPSPVSVESAKLQRNHPMADRLFAALLAAGGSDLHCSCYEVPQARVSGDMVELEDFSIVGEREMMGLMEAIATPSAWESFRRTRDADFAYPFEAGQCRMRVNYFMDRVGPGFVARVIPDKIPDPEKLGLPQPVCRLANLPKGLVLVTGPTGSGKSTTLAAIIDIANRTRHDHILTIEDPIEFVHPKKKCLVNQREVGTHTDSFKSGLRAALREDPDIVLVGEMRDLETIAIALETAITGHLVFGTLHTNSAIGTVDRIVDQFPSDRQQQIRVMLADALKAVVSQALLKRVGGGRVAALETLFVTPAIANLIREGKNFQITSSMQTGRAYGQRLMDDALVDLVKAKQVAPMDAYLKAPDRASFIAACKRNGVDFDLRAAEALEGA